ncbi:tetratricopeptide repeat protein [Dactylosporangium cerinum]|uniref:Tetratricopeptide repeat protein n=1 Tax=Dactylosporangium cerinum TaxID=1434730 RepID=A0ABV9VXK0_9ACTN
MRLRAYRGVPLWPSVLTEWALRAVAVLPPVALAGGAWLIWGNWIATGVAALLGAGVAFVALGAVLGDPHETLSGRRLRCALAKDPGMELHARVLAELGRRGPEGERLLREEIAGGSLPHLRELVSLLHHYQREDDVRALATQIAGSGTVEQLRVMVSTPYRYPGFARWLQAEMVTRRPDDVHERLLYAALLGESEATDEAMAELDTVMALLGDAPLDRRAADLLQRVARGFVERKRAADAEQVLRLGMRDPNVLAALAGLLVQRRKPAQAVKVLRAHPVKDDLVVNYALYLILRGRGKAAEAEALVPPGGWPRQMTRPRPAPVGPSWSYPGGTGAGVPWPGSALEGVVDGVVTGLVHRAFDSGGGGDPGYTASSDDSGYSSDPSGGGYSSDSSW